MDFFSHQDSARRNTKYLVLLFVVAVFLLICLANVIIAVVLWMSSADSINNLSSFFNWQIFGLVCLGVNSVVALAISYKWMRISDGGGSVAESLGGTRILPNTSKLAEKRVLNVVEEMALASGMPVPPVYLLTRERGINAFAAGNSPADAVIGITKGSLEQFNREQLQGVIAHEFSHILNGDMRLNLRLIALLNGILFLGNCGQLIMRGGGYSHRSMRRSGSGRLLLLGLAMAMIGWIGTFFGGLIKAAINRQREFLADASAVQFTRNPMGIADALKIIGGFKHGSRVVSGSAVETSHLFISNALSGLAFFKTHPPLGDRIRRIEPDWDGRMIRNKVMSIDENSDDESVTESKRDSVKLATTVILGTVLGQARTSELQSGQAEGFLTESLLQKLHDPFSATCLLYSLLLDNDKQVMKKQLAIIESNGAQGSADMSCKISAELRGVDSSLRIILVEKAMPALKCMSEGQYLALKKCIKLLIHADKVIELFEWCLFQMVRHYLGAEFGDRRPGRPRFSDISDVADDYVLVVSTIIHHCHLQLDTAERAFSRGTNSAGLYTGSLLSQHECTMESFMKGVNVLADCYPLLKARLLKGLSNVIEFDGTVTPMEKELVISIAAVMDSPLPRIAIS